MTLPLESCIDSPKTGSEFVSILSLSPETKVIGRCGAFMF